MKKFRTWYDDKIEEVEVVRETEQSVFLPINSAFHKNGERREAKHTDRINYFDTWGDAKRFLINRTSIELKRTYAKADRLEETLKMIEAMQHE